VRDVNVRGTKEGKFARSGVEKCEMFLFGLYY
jgi:hypothetical protein